VYNAKYDLNNFVEYYFRRDRAKYGRSKCLVSRSKYLISRSKYLISRSKCLFSRSKYLIDVEHFGNTYAVDDNWE